MSTLTVNGIAITLSASENEGNNQYTLNGTYDSGTSGQNFGFQFRNQPGNNNYDGKTIEIIQSTTTTSPISIIHEGHPSSIWVWTDLTETDIDGVEVILQEPDKE